MNKKVLIIEKRNHIGGNAFDYFNEKTNVIFADTMEDAVKKAYELAKPGEIVLLSPACASFDMFNNYEHRGQVFKKCVYNLVK